MASVDISNNSYSQKMSRKSEQYKRLVLRAGLTRRENGRPTKAEALLYAEAAQVCEEIMALNEGNRSTYAVWSRLRDDCTDLVEDIVNAVAPAPLEPAPPRVTVRPVAPAAPDKPRTPGKTEPPAQDGTAAGEGGDPRPYTETSTGFRTRNASKHIPAETIEQWHLLKPDHGLCDVIGMETQRDLLMREIRKMGYTRTSSLLSLSPANAYLFYGPPGSGKTFLINAFVHDIMERGYRFIRLQGSDIQQPLVGVGPQTVQTAFQEAIDCAPCVIFIDELEIVCPNRGGPEVKGHEGALTGAFLTALDGMIAAKKDVIFLGATNFPDRLDPAMRRRVRMTYVPLPSGQAREHFFRDKLKHFPLEEGLDYAYLAEQTDRFSYGDLNHLIEDIHYDAWSRAITDYAVADPSGEPDVEQTDIRACEALRNGEIVLTRAWFDRSRAANPPTNIADILEHLRAFEQKGGNWMTASAQPNSGGGQRGEDRG